MNIKNSFLGFAVSLLLCGGAHAQAPDLGMASTFALFTVTGAVSNTGGLTNVVGDIGSDCGAISSFTPGQVVGNTQSANSVSSQASKDIKKVYDKLVTLAPTPGIQTGCQLGQKTLGPGVYYFGGATDISGTLTLDGHNDPGSIFVFQINGALTVAATSSVVLINGASPNHIFWQSGGAASFAASSNFAGIIVANGAVAFGDNTTLLGKGMSVAGAISVYNSQVKTTNSSTPLPVQLTTFSVVSLSGGNNINWTTASEKNSAYFSLEHSSDGSKFRHVTKLDARGNSSLPSVYSYMDAEKHPESRSYYRLKQVDRDSTTTYYTVRSCNNTRYPIVAYPNPFQDQLTVVVPRDGDVMSKINVLDTGGRSVSTSESYSVEILVDTRRFLPGMYTVVVQNGNQRKTIKVVKVQ